MKWMRSKKRWTNWVTRYPDEERFLANYGKRLVWKGETSKGLSLLEKVGGMVFQDSELALAYLKPRVNRITDLWLLKIR